MSKQGRINPYAPKYVAKPGTKANPYKGKNLVKRVQQGSKTAQLPTLLSNQPSAIASTPVVATVASQNMAYNQGLAEMLKYSDLKKGDISVIEEYLQVYGGSEEQRRQLAQIKKNLESGMGNAPASSPARVTRTRAELYAKNNMVAPNIRSEVAISEGLAAKELNKGLMQHVEQQAATIAGQSSTIAHQGTAIAEQSIQLDNAAAKITEQGQQLTDAGNKIAGQGAKIGQLKKALKWGLIGAAVIGVGLGIWALLSNRKKNEQIAEQQNADAANQAKIADLEQQLADCQEQQNEQVVITEPEQPEVTPENPEDVPGSEGYDYKRLAVYGDCIWNYCREQLTEELKRTPTDREVFLTSRAYREAHNIPLIDNWFAPLQPNDTLWSIPKLPEVFEK